MMQQLACMLHKMHERKRMVNKGLSKVPKGMRTTV